MLVVQPALHAVHTDRASSERDVDWPATARATATPPDAAGSATAPTVYGLQFEDDGCRGIDLDGYNRNAGWAFVTGGATVCPSTVTVSHGNVTNTYTFATMRRS
jgi:hypothetical protein